MSAISSMEAIRYRFPASMPRTGEIGIGPEAGTTYTLGIFGETDALLRTVTGLTGTSYTYLAADEQADSGYVPARLNTSLRFELGVCGMDWSV